MVAVRAYSHSTRSSIVHKAGDRGITPSDVPARIEAGEEGIGEEMLVDIRKTFPPRICSRILIGCVAWQPTSDPIGAAASCCPRFLLTRALLMTSSDSEGHFRLGRSQSSVGTGHCTKSPWVTTLSDHALPIENLLEDTDGVLRSRLVGVVAEQSISGPRRCGSLFLRVCALVTSFS